MYSVQMLTRWAGEREGQTMKPSKLRIGYVTQTHLLQVCTRRSCGSDDTYSSRCDVVEDSGTAVVVLVRHVALHGGVGLDVDDIANLVVDQVRRHLDRAGLCGRSEWWCNERVGGVRMGIT